MPRFACLALIVCLPLSSVAHSRPAEVAVRATALDEAMHAGTFRQVTSVLVSTNRWVSIAWRGTDLVRVRFRPAVELSSHRNHYVDLLN